MCVEIKQNIPAEEIYRYMEKLDFPTQYHPDFGRWEDSFLRDVDGEGLCGRGLGTRFMAALKADLYRQGAVRLDTDTAMTNTAAQRFYEKTGFARQGVTRSYVRVEV